MTLLSVVETADGKIKLLVAEGESVPGPVEAALRAWLHLEARNLPWKPDSVSVFQDDEDQIRRMRTHGELLDQLMTTVEARGGPANPWAVDLAKQRATFGPAEVSFYRLANGGFSPSTYRRLDRAPTANDTIEIQDACYCIAQAFSRARQANKALTDIADYTRKHAAIFAQDGAASLSPADAARRTAKITALADELNGLAAQALACFPVALLIAGDDGVAATAEVLPVHPRLHARHHADPPPARAGRRFRRRRRCS